MAQHTLDLGDGDLEMWGRAEALVGAARLPSLVTALLRGYVGTNSRLEGEMGRIEVEAEVMDEVVTKAFTGVWLMEPHYKATRTTEEGWDAGSYWGVAQTGKGQIAVWIGHCNYAWPPSLMIYESIDHAEADSALPADIAAVARNAQGLPAVMELDV